MSADQNPTMLQIVEIEGYTRKFGGENYQTLCVRDETLDDGSNVIVSEWKPTPEQIVAIAGGASIYLGVIEDEHHPPVMLMVGANG